ncbi:MAG: serine/threonine protein kinase [Dehalococcoidia bacterium]
MADALDYAHRRGVVHCDIKPGNVLLPALDTPKIVDFGIARAGTAAPDGDSIAGTAGYIAPEQLAGHTPDGRADVFALGAVLYEMIVGAPAFPSRSLAAAARRADEPPLPPHQRNAAVPPGLGAVVMRALAPSPTDRFQTAAAFAAALRQTAAEGATREAPRRVAPPRSSEQATQVAPAPLPVATRRTPWVALVLVGVVAVAAAGAGAFVALGALGFGQAKTAAPNVVGRPITDAADQIHAAGLEVATPVVFRRATQPFGAVIEQQPRAGTSLSEGAVVQLVVSCGEARAAECE